MCPSFYSNNYKESFYIKYSCPNRLIHLPKYKVEIENTNFCQKINSASKMDFFVKK